MRVIAGEFGGRRLVAPRGQATRPTSDRVRESLFMTLEPLDGLEVVDLFAGSGALGIEAVSRGAAHVHFVEFGRDALRVIERNLSELGILDRATIWRLRLPQGFKRLATVLREADLVLADPPYGGEMARTVIEALGAPDVLSPRARCVIEHHAKDALPSASGMLTRASQRRYGETDITLYVSREPATAAAEDQSA